MKMFGTNERDKKDFKFAHTGTSIEINMFLANLTCYLLEEGIDVSYNGCFKHDALLWQQEGLKEVINKPIIMMSMNYADKYRKDVLDSKHILEDIKPELKDVIEWQRMIDLQLFKNIMAESKRNNVDVLDSYSPNQFKTKERPNRSCKGFECYK